MHFELHGRQDPAAETLLLSSGLGGAEAFWAPQLATLGERFRVVVYDQTGTGRSPAELPADYRIQHMAEDLLALADRLELDRCLFMGHALGGLVGLQASLLRPGLIRRQVLVNAWSRPNPHTRRCFALRQRLLRDSGAAAYVQAQAIFLYPATWIADHGERLAADEAHALAHFPGEANVLRRIGALLAFDVDAELARIEVPTLVLANRDDVLVPWTSSQRLATGLPRASFELLEWGGHASSVTDPATFDRVVLDYLSQSSEE